MVDFVHRRMVLKNQNALLGFGHREAVADAFRTPKQPGTSGIQSGPSR